MQKHFGLGVILTLLLATVPSAVAQVSSTGSLAGTVTDPAAAVVVGASVVVKNDATGSEFTATTSDNGTFNVPALPAGTYTVTITAPGFKRLVVRGVKVDVGKPSSISSALEVGAPEESVTIEGGAELLQTQSANVATTITGRQITDLPFTSRDALDLVLLLPGTQTPARPRSSTVNGLPKGSLNITIDGLNVQDNGSKSGDGFFTYIRPRIDAIDEVTVSTATPGAESAGEGAVQIKFVTRSGTNDYHGSLYWYHRNPALNANYWFSNRDLPPDPETGKAPRARVLLNQPGGRVGGPISIPGLFSGRDRAFFFVNYEEYRLPEQVTRTRTILTEEASRGVFRYNTSTGQRTVDLLALAASRGQTSTVDPSVANVLRDIRAATARGGVTPFDLIRERFAFTNTGGQKRRFGAVRLDFNLTSNHHLENVWNYQTFRNRNDFLNGADEPFPGFPSFGSQDSNRFSNSTALRSTFTPHLVNEARFGVSGGGITLFRPGLSAEQFARNGGYAFGTSATSTTTGWGLALSINNPNGPRSSSRNNNPVKQFMDTVTYTRGSHTMNFGGSFTQVNTFNSALNNIVPSLNFGVDSSDPAASLFVAANFPGSSAADRTRAQNLYAVLTGRVTSVNANAYLDEETNNYTYLGRFVERIRQREFGLFAQDSWRYSPNLTLNFGLRYEVQFPFTALNNSYTQVPFDEIWGISGRGNLFRPDLQTGKVSEFIPFPAGTRAFNTDYNNFAPSVGIAYSPDWKGGILNRLLGDAGQSVFRAGYSIAYVREGQDVVSSILGGNTGGIIAVTRSVTLPGANRLEPGTLLRNLPSGPPPFPTSPTFPLRGLATEDVNAFDPNLKVGYVQSWTAGVQREITKNMVFEARYVGNRGIKLWRQYDINETNVLENGFINEFRLAQANLLANNAAGGARAGSFGYFGPGTNTSPLPITLAYFTGLNIFRNVPLTSPTNPANVASNYSNASNSPFRTSTFVNPLATTNANPIGLAEALFANSTRRGNAVAAGLVPNFFVVNPDYLGGAFIVDNGGHTWYDGLTLELRRRLSRGLLVQGSYTFSKSLSNMFASANALNADYSTLRDTSLDKTNSPWDLRHALKVNWIYELPLGRGHAFLGDSGGVVNHLVGGWEIHGAARVQSGSALNLGNVQLVGMTREELQRSLKIRKNATNVTWLPEDIILNTRRAFNTDPTSPTGYGTLGPPEGRYIAPPGAGNCAQAYVGQCGFSNLVLYGPKFTKFDISFVKKIRFTERANLELRGELLNAFNNINFKIGSQTSEISNITGFALDTFGQTNIAYQDTSTTNDPGGRLVQFVLRFNF